MELRRASFSSFLSCRAREVKFDFDHKSQPDVCLGFRDTAGCSLWAGLMVL